MICLEFSLNGKEKVIAGNADAEIVTAMAIAYPQLRECGVTLFGDLLPKNQPPASASWFNRTLKVGDVVSIRVVEADNPTAATISRADPAAVATGQKPLICSFCAKTDKEVESMANGNKAMICNECIESLHQTEILDRQQDQMLDASDDA